MDIDLGSVWNLVLSSTQKAQQQSPSSNGVLGDSVVSDIVKSIMMKAVTGSLTSSSNSKASSSSSMDMMSIATMLLGLYNQHKNSSDPTEQQAASNIKKISSVISAMSGNVSGESAANAGADFLKKAIAAKEKGTTIQAQMPKEDKGGDMAEMLKKGIDILGGLFGKK